MTRRSLGGVRQLLIRQRELVHRNKRLERNAVRESSEALLQTACDSADTSQLDEQIDVNLAVLDLNARTGRQLDRAIERLDQGIYGVCQSCGGGISPVRLRALPFATQCLHCALEDERDLQPGAATHSITASL